MEAREAGRGQSSKVRWAGKRGIRRTDGTSGSGRKELQAYKQGKVRQRMEVVSPEWGSASEMYTLKGNYEKREKKKEEPNACFQD